MEREQTATLEPPLGETGGQEFGEFSHQDGSMISNKNIRSSARENSKFMALEGSNYQTCDDIVIPAL